MQARLPRPSCPRGVLAAACLALSALAACAVQAATPDEASVVASAEHPSALHKSPAAVPQRGPLAEFGKVHAPANVREIANWAFYTRDNQGRAVVILDKQGATVYAFDPEGRLVAHAPALLGMAVGDDTVPGVGDKPLSQVPERERTTPAGRFVAEPGVDDTGTDVVWIDYDTGVAMHRVITTFPEQHRPERLRSPNAKDRRISYGCINLPIPFYEKVLSPTVHKTGAIVYVLPETKPVSEVFGSWDVTDPAAQARHEESRAARGAPEAAAAKAPT